MKKKNNRLNRKGFTLIELLVVISVLSLVVSISMYFIVGTLAKARENTYKTTINEVEKAAGNYLKENSDNLVFVKGNENIEYQCVSVKDLIDYGFLNNDVIKSKIDDDGHTINIDNNIYIERDSKTKAIKKNVYIKDLENDINRICTFSIVVKGNIYFNINPVGWSKNKNVAISYTLKNAQDISNYAYEYVYYGSNGNIISEQSNSNNDKELTVNENGNIYADIKNITDESIITSANQIISNIDNTGPIIKLVRKNEEKQYVSKSVIIPIEIKDCVNSGIGCSGLKEYSQDKLTDMISSNKIVVKIGDKNVNANVSLTRSDDSIFNLTINDNNDNGNVSIEILADTFVDKVLDEVKNGNDNTVLIPNIEFDNIKPSVAYTSSDDPFVNSQTLTIECSDNNAVGGYYFGKSENSNYEEVATVTNFQVQQLVNDSGTYYLSCKDAANNVETVQIKYVNYSFRYMLSLENGSEGTFTLSNYSQVGDVHSYLILNGGLLSQSDVEQVVSSNTPVGSNYGNNYVGYSKINANQNISKGYLYNVSNQFNSSDFNVNDNYIYVFWFNRNVLSIKYKINSDESLVPGSADSNVYGWENDSGYVKRIKLSDNTSTTMFQKYKYKSGNTSINLYDNDTNKHFAIQKNSGGYLPVNGNEWKCINGCKVDGKTFGQDELSVNVNNEICDISNDNCTIVLQVNWNSISYNISYNLNNGMYGTNHPSSADYDSVISISNPTKTVTITGNANGTGATVGSDTSKDQIFNGWVSSSIDSGAKTGTSTDSMISWNGTSTKNTYFKNLKQANGSVVMDAVWTPVLMKLPTVSKSGYTCKWFIKSGNDNVGTEVGESGGDYLPSADSAANITVYARCTENSHTLTYNCTENGGTTTNITQQYLPDESVNLERTCTKSGWTHIGWNTDKDAHEELSSYSMPSSNSELYAIYKKNVKITFNANNSGETLTNTLTNETSTTTMDISCTAYNKTGCQIITPSISGVPYYFSTNSDDKNPWNSSQHWFHESKTSYITENKTYYVVYKKYTITFNKNGADKIGNSTVSSIVSSCAYAPNTDSSKEKCKITSPSITKSGYTVIGWGTSSSATTSSWTPGTEKSVASDGTYYANYKKTVNITFNTNGSGTTLSHSTGNSTTTLVVSCTDYNGNGCSIVTPSISGAPYYYSTSSTDKTLWDKAPSGVTHWWHESPVGFQKNNKTFYVVYGRFTITFNKNGASAIGATSRSCIYAPGAASCSVTSPSITAGSGYTAVGWNTNSSATTSTWNVGTAKTISSNGTYYAIRKQNVTYYTATFSKNGHGYWTKSGWSGNSYTLTYTGSYSISHIIKSDDCAFKGWYVQETGNTYQYNIDSSDNGRHLNAQWKCSDSRYNGECYCNSDSDCYSPNNSTLRTRCKDGYCQWTSQTGVFVDWEMCS